MFSFSNSLSLTLSFQRSRVKIHHFVVSSHVISSKTNTVGSRLGPNDDGKTALSKRSKYNVSLQMCVTCLSSAWLSSQISAAQTARNWMSAKLTASQWTRPRISWTRCFLQVENDQDQTVAISNKVSLKLYSVKRITYGFSPNLIYLTKRTIKVSLK